ncbi:alpha/beta hydrolase [uncultured Roseobacter sp.]|uniref:alpha/beta hydrolase n=1 Tax=uncultured Roseobacter sp. TaxID=114847 RepID=UPI0026071074|nr:alpha/beta hydrolase [uncultured Roseobacter sp.]
MTTLDDAYANAAHIPAAEDYPPRWEAAAAAFREGLGTRAQVGLSYGASPRQKVDLFHPEGVPQGTMVFVHGGYWKAFDRSTWSHLAAGALAANWAVALPGYDLCPDVRIPQITRQIAAAVTDIADRTDGAIVLAGHSAGGHLVARMLDDRLLRDAVLRRIERVAPISPVADLSPLLQTSMNEILQLTPEDAHAESPVNMAASGGAAVHVWVGAEERPVFLEQAAALAAAWDVPHTVVPETHHFDVIDALEDPESDLLRFLTGR